jgi:hypothetical protein
MHSYKVIAFGTPPDMDQEKGTFWEFSFGGKGGGNVYLSLWQRWVDEVYLSCVRPNAYSIKSIRGLLIGSDTMDAKCDWET